MVITKTNASAISKGIEISADNELYTIEEGVLFNKNKTILIAYSKSKKDSTYVIPDSVTTIDSDAFCGNNYLTTLYINQNLQAIGNGALYNTPKLTNFVVNKKNTSFIYKDNCFQTVSGDIIKYVGGSASIFNVSSNCRLIHKGAFDRQNRNLSQINIPYNSNIESIGKYNFNNFANQVKIEYYADNEASYNTVINYLNSNITRTNAHIYLLKSISIENSPTHTADIYSYKIATSVNKHIINFSSFNNVTDFIVNKKMCKIYESKNESVTKNSTIDAGSDYIGKENHIDNFTFKINLDKNGWIDFDKKNELKIESEYYGEHTLNIRAYYNGIEINNDIYQTKIIDLPMSNIEGTTYNHYLTVDNNYWLIKFNNNDNNSEIQSMKFTFSNDSKTEGSSDLIYFGNIINKAQVTQYGSINNVTTSGISPKDNVCMVSFKTDSSVAYRGFAIVKVIVNYNDGTSKTFDGSEYYTGQEI